MDVLEGANHVLESRSLTERGLEKRQSSFLGAAGVLLAGLLFPIFYKGDHTVPVPIKIPPEQLEESFDLETATAIIIVTDDNMSGMAITQPPEQAKATGYADSPIPLLLPGLLG
jgi:hypothetical protein